MSEGRPRWKLADFRLDQASESTRPPPQRSELPSELHPGPTDDKEENSLEGRRGRLGSR